MKKLIISIVLTMFLVFTAKSQFYMGGNLSFSNYLGGTGLKSLGIGLTGEWSPDQDRTLTRISFTYGFPSSEEATYTAEAIDPFITNPDYIDVTGKTKIGFMHLNVDYKRFFGDGDYEDGGFYGFLGAGLSIAKVTYVIDSFDESKYEIKYSYDPESFFQFTLKGGIGYDISLDFGNLYGEAFLNVPANNVNGAYIAIQIPMAVGLQAGIRIPIGG